MAEASGGLKPRARMGVRASRRRKEPAEPAQGPKGPRWLVSRTTGENAASAKEENPTEVWKRACEQAEVAGMLGRAR